MSWPFTWSREQRIKAAREAILPLLIDRGVEPRRGSEAGGSGWLIPATEGDAALMLDEIAAAAIDAQRYPLP